MVNRLKQKFLEHGITQEYLYQYAGLDMDSKTFDFRVTPQHKGRGLYADFFRLEVFDGTGKTKVCFVKQYKSNEQLREHDPYDGSLEEDVKDPAAYEFMFLHNLGIAGCTFHPRTGSILMPYYGGTFEDLLLNQIKEYPTAGNERQADLEAATLHDVHAICYHMLENYIRLYSQSSTSRMRIGDIPLIDAPSSLGISTRLGMYFESLYKLKRGERGFGQWNIQYVMPAGDEISLISDMLSREGGTIVHQDFRPENILYTTDTTGEHMFEIFDWRHAGFGTLNLDFATLFYAYELMQFCDTSRQKDRVIIRPDVGVRDMVKDIIMNSMACNTRIHHHIATGGDPDVAAAKIPEWMSSYGLHPRLSQELGRLGIWELLKRAGLYARFQTTPDFQRYLETKGEYADLYSDPHTYVDFHLEEFLRICKGNGEGRGERFPSLAHLVRSLLHPHEKLDEPTLRRKNGDPFFMATMNSF